MTTLEATILESVTRYEYESGRKLPGKSFYKSIVLDIMRKYINATISTRNLSEFNA